MSRFLHRRDPVCGIPMQWLLHSESVWCRHLGHPMKDGGRMSFLHDRTSSGLMAVVKSTQPTIRTISGQETTSQSADVPI